VRNQNDAGLRDVRVQGGTAGSNQEGLGLLQPQSVQPVQSGSVVGGQDSVQDEITGTAGTRASTDELTAGRDADVIRDEAEKKIRELLVASFGERDTNIIYDVLMNDLSGPQIAKKYGISQQRVDQIAGPKAQKTWGPRIEKGAKRLGMSIDQVEAMFAPFESDKTISNSDAIAEAQARLDAELLGKELPKASTDQVDNTEAEAEPEERIDIESTTRTLSDEFDKDSADSEYGSELGTDDLFDKDTEGTSKNKGFRVFKVGKSGEVGADDASANNRSYAKFKENGASKLKEFEVNNILAEVEDLTDSELLELLARAKQLEVLRLAEAEEKRNKGKKDAVQKSSTEEVPVRKRSEASGKVAEGDTKERKAAAESEAKTEEVVVKTPEEQWTETVAPFDGAPWADLSKEQQDRWADLVNHGTADLAAANTIARQMKGADREAKVKLTPEQKLFFKSLDYSENIKSGEKTYEAAEVTPNELFELFPGIRVVDDMFARLNLSQVVSGVQKILVFKGPVQNAAMVVHRQMPNGSIQTMLAFNESTLSSTDQDSLGYTFTHETGHLVDYAGFGGVYSSHPDMGFVVKNGKYVSTGSVSRAFVNWVNNPNTNPELTELMMYPLQYTPDQMEMQEMKEELFAQGWALFLNPKYNRMMSEQAPAVYQFYSVGIQPCCADSPRLQYKLAVGRRSPRSS